jgi:hypothetical protein
MIYNLLFVLFFYFIIFSAYLSFIARPYVKHFANRLCLRLFGMQLKTKPKEAAHGMSGLA